MKWPIFFLSLFLSSLLNSAISKLAIISPEKLVSQINKKDGLDFKVLDFGKFPFGINFVGKLVLANPIDACHPIPAFHKGERPSDGNIIIVATRGGCRESTKVSSVEQSGAQMLLLVNFEDSLEAVHGMQSNHQAHIPTVMIQRNYGDQIIEFLRQNLERGKREKTEDAYASITFPSEVKKKSVNLDFWFSSSDAFHVASDFLFRFYPILQEERESFIFTPHFVTWTCGKCKVDGFTYSDVDCISGGRYCAPDPDEKGPQTGKDIIMEDLRQMCIWKTQEDLWWRYVQKFENKCLKKENLSSCSHKILEDTATAEQILQVTACVESSWIRTPGQKANDDMDDNRLMKAEKQLQDELDVTHFPLLYINYQKYFGKLFHIHHIYRELCEQLLVPSDTCMELLESHFPTEMFTRHKVKKVFKQALIYTLVVSLCALGVFLIYKRVGKRERRDMSLEMNNLVYNYFALQDREEISIRDNN